MPDTSTSALVPRPPRQSIPWRCIVVDEVHRLKNKDSALASELRTLRAEQTFMLTGTPLQNNTTELWALLSLLSPDLFPSLESFLHQFGTLTGAAQVDELRDKIRPYLLRRHKSDVEKDLAPMVETIVWVEMTLLQVTTVTRRLYDGYMTVTRRLHVSRDDTAAGVTTLLCLV